MKLLKKYLIICMLITSLIGTSFYSHAQSAAEVNLLRSINPVNPNNPLFKALSSTDKPIALGVPLGILAVALLQHQVSGEINGVEMLAGLGITTVATTALKAIIKRPRPYVTYSDIYPDAIDDSYSFPSGHTSIAFSTATSLALIYKKWYITIPAYAWATGVGYSRMYLGQHYPSDVLAGAATGAASAFISHWLNKKFFFKKKK